jgi:hypothetical protein
MTDRQIQPPVVPLISRWVGSRGGGAASINNLCAKQGQTIDPQDR